MPNNVILAPFQLQTGPPWVLGLGSVINNHRERSNSMVYSWVSSLDRLHQPRCTMRSFPELPINHVLPDVYVHVYEKFDAINSSDTNLTSLSAFHIVTFS
ncbi:hypothetical protein L1887_06468 [Cichorium endivia]|nr:hypothetical protein L1887_06468 [Cichorium endivia]